MNRIIFILLMAFCQLAQAQFQSGFSGRLSRELMGLNTTFTFEHLYGTDKAIIPKGYDKLFTSDVVGMDNKFHVFKKGKIGIISFRGSTNKSISWVENFYSSMIPARGEIMLKGAAHPYEFAADEDAAVHAGYALAIMFLSEQLLPQIKTLNEEGIYDIIITGHSQGGALSTLTRCYLENLSSDQLDPKNKFRTYAFGNPMSGNREFAEEYDRKYSEKGTAFTIVNPYDPVPYMPLNYDEEGKLLSKKKIIGWFSGKEKFNFLKFGKELVLRTFDSGLASQMGKHNSLLESLISLKFGQVDMPSYVMDINYFPAGKRIELEKFDYPEIRKKRKELTDDELSDYKENEDGYWYRKEPKFFQHNPYNYYVGVAKNYDKKSYNKLKKKYLDVNL